MSRFQDGQCFFASHRTATSIALHYNNPKTSLTQSWGKKLRVAIPIVLFRHRCLPQGLTSKCESYIFPKPCSFTTIDLVTFAHNDTPTPIGWCWKELHIRKIERLGQYGASYSRIEFIITADGTNFAT